MISGEPTSQRRWISLHSRGPGGSSGSNRTRREVEERTDRAWCLSFEAGVLPTDDNEEIKEQVNILQTAWLGLFRLFYATPQGRKESTK